MKSVLILAKNKLGLLAAITLAAIFGGVASAVVMAAIPDGSGTIHACYKSSGLLASGQLRLIDNSMQSCNSNETPLNWEQNPVIGNSLAAAFGTISPDNTATVLAIPGLGKLQAVNCDSNGSDEYDYYNDTTGTVLVNGTHVEPGGITPATSGFYSGGSGGTSKMAYVNVGLNATGDPYNQCYFQAQATLNP